VTLALISNIKIGSLYFLSFTLLAPNMSNYIFTETLPNSFYGLRLFGFSFNVLYTIFLSGILLLNSSTKNIFSFYKRGIYKFISLFIIYSSILGVFMVALGYSYFDNYLKDLMTYLPFFFYVIFLSFLKDEDIKPLIKYLIICTYFLFLFSFVFSKYSQYVLGENILLSNTFTSVFIIVIFFCRNFFKLYQYAFILVSYLLLLSTGIIILGGKSFVYLFILLLWLVVKEKKLKYILPVVIIFFFINQILSSIINYYEGNVIAMKLAQVSYLFNFIDLHTLANVKSSIGNIAGELLTLIDYSRAHLMFFLFGKGMGGGLPDSLGYLYYWAGNNGYSEVDSFRNNYHKFHLALYEIFIKSGIIFFVIYIRIAFKKFLTSNSSGLIFVIFFLLMFSVSKEYILLTLLFERYTRISSDGNQNMDSYYENNCI
jgi:hypothetical protein